MWEPPEDYEWNTSRAEMKPELFGPKPETETTLFPPKEEVGTPIQKYNSPATFLGEGQNVSQYPNLSGRLSQPETPWYQHLSNMGPLMARLGFGISGGPQSYTGQTIGSVMPALEGMAMNRALRKMMSDYLAGKSTNMGPTSGPEQIGLEDSAALGLTPEAVKIAYGMGMEATEKSRTEPFRMMALAADAHNRIAAGDLHAVQIPHVLAQTEAIYEQIAQMPVKSWLEYQEKQMHMFRLQADMAKLSVQLEEMKQSTEESKARTEKIRKAEIPEAQARAKRTEIETEGLRQDQFWKTEEGRTVAADIDAWKNRMSDRVREIDLGDQILLYDPITKQEKRFNKGAKPGEGAGKAAQVGILGMSAQLAIRDYMKEAEAGYIKSFAGDKQKAAEGYQTLLKMLQDPNENVAAGAAIQLSRFLSPQSQTEFVQKWGTHARSLADQARPALPSTGTIPPPGGAPPPPPGAGAGAGVAPPSKMPVLDENVIKPLLKRKAAETGKLKQQYTSAQAVEDVMTELKLPPQYRPAVKQFIKRWITPPKE